MVWGRRPSERALADGDLPHRLALAQPEAGVLDLQSLAVDAVEAVLLCRGLGLRRRQAVALAVVQAQFHMLIVLVNFWQVAPETAKATFDEPGDHAGELETSFLLHVRPAWVGMGQASSGKTVPFQIEALKQPGVWTPRPWSATHPDTGCGDPSRATAEKGRAYFEALTAAVANLFVELSAARKGQSPYL